MTDRPINLNITYVYIINEDLDMSKGKIAAQVSHVAMLLADYNYPIGKAIVLKASQDLLESLIRDYPDQIKYIRDAGLTEVPAGSLTCVGFVREPELKYVTGHLKLV